MVEKLLEPGTAAAQGGKEGLGLGKEAGEHSADELHVPEPNLFRPLQGRLVFFVLMDLEEELRALDHVLPALSGGRFVGLEKDLQLPGAQGRDRQVVGQLLRMGRVGARQRDQNTGGAPGGDVAGSDQIQDLV